jgi:hypothetical protein
MRSEKCNSCSAPVSAASMACAFCGAVLRSPQGVEEELTVLREQALAAQSQKMFFEPAKFWQNAFVPASVPALRLALDQCATFAPSSGVQQHLTQVFLSRAEGLKMRLTYHDQASDNDKAAAARVVELLSERKRVADNEASKHNRTVILTLLGLIPVVGLLIWLNKIGVLK